MLSLRAVHDYRVQSLENTSLSHHTAGFSLPVVATLQGDFTDSYEVRRLYNSDELRVSKQMQTS